MSLMFQNLIILWKRLQMCIVCLYSQFTDPQKKCCAPTEAAWRYLRLHLHPSWVTWWHADGSADVDATKMSWALSHTHACAWPHRFSSVHVNVSWATLKGQLDWHPLKQQEATSTDKMHPRTDGMHSLCLRKKRRSHEPQLYFKSHSS